MLKKILLVLGATMALLLVAVVAVAFYLDVPRMLIGYMNYGHQVREGTLKVGDAAPEVSLYALDGGAARPLSAWTGSKSLVLIFGSFT
jgi:hypothetical protein